MIPLLVAVAAAEEPLPGLPPREDDIQDFRPGNVDLKAKFAFDAVGPSPLSLASAFGGWNELTVGAEVGVFEIEDVTFGVGGELYVARPWMFELLSELFVNVLSDDLTLDWSATEWGALGRGAVHYNGLDTFEFYGLFLFGPNHYAFRLELEDADGNTLSGAHRSAGLRIGAGGGFSTAVGDGWLFGAEGRYLVSPRFKAATSVELTDASGATVEVFDTVLYQRGPKGFSWVLWFGRRF